MTELVSMSKYAQPGVDFLYGGALIIVLSFSGTGDQGRAKKVGSGEPLSRQFSSFLKSGNGTF